jgi:polar amino acid transport system substrate-binding protein
MRTGTRLALALMMAGMLATPALADLKVAVDSGAYPPFAAPDPTGKWGGWEIDVLDALCAELKEKCEIVPTAWVDLIPQLKADHFDMIVASMTITEERMKSIQFSRMYYERPVVMVGANDGDLDITPAHLEARIIGVQASTAHVAYVKKYFVPAGAVMKTYQTQDEANQDLAAGRINYVQGDGAVLGAFLKTDQGKACCELKGRIASDLETIGTGVGVGLRKRDTALLNRINAAIAAMAVAGTFKNITTKYPELADAILTP